MVVARDSRAAARPQWRAYCSRLFAPPDAALLGMAAPIADAAAMLNLIIVPALLADALLIAAIVYDWRTRGRPHRVYVIGGLCLVGRNCYDP